jgi:DNA-binding Lrp family transcriptional regulator
VNELDSLILNHLRADGRLTMVQLGGLVGLSTSAAQRRVKSLEDRGVLRGFRAVVDHVAVGEGFEVWVSAWLNSTAADAVAQIEAAIADIDEVMECYRMFGEPDYLMRVAVLDLDAYEALWSTRLSQLDGAGRVASQMSMKVIKR